ncbi:MAG: SRPBCC domain-containing protein [Anaerolineae bacterium]|nr:MAG: SRPBCC domain-containing protein [Anaerolineae bacterium]
MTEQTFPTLRMSIDIFAPLEKVWALVSTPEGVRQWFTRQTFEPRPGGRLEMHVDYGTPTTITGEVTVFEPPHRLGFTWKQHEQGHEPWPVDTLVLFLLEAIEGGTRVTLEHSGFDALPGAIAMAEFEAHVDGWTRANTLPELKETAEAMK